VVWITENEIRIPLRTGALKLGGLCGPEHLD